MKSTILFSTHIDRVNIKFSLSEISIFFFFLLEYHQTKKKVRPGTKGTTLKALYNHTE